jgi:hypothetical protein
VCAGVVFAGTSRECADGLPASVSLPAGRRGTFAVRAAAAVVLFVATLPAERRPAGLHAHAGLPGRGVEPGATGRAEAPVAHAGGGAAAFAVSRRHRPATLPALPPAIAVRHAVRPRCAGRATQLGSGRRFASGTVRHGHPMLSSRGCGDARQGDFRAQWVRRTEAASARPSRPRIGKRGGRAERRAGPHSRLQVGGAGRGQRVFCLCASTRRR